MIAQDNQIIDTEDIYNELTGGDICCVKRNISQQAICDAQESYARFQEFYATYIKEELNTEELKDQVIKVVPELQQKVGTSQVGWNEYISSFLNQYVDLICTSIINKEISPAEVGEKSLKWKVILYVIIPILEGWKNKYQTTPVPEVSIKNNDQGDAVRTSFANMVENYFDNIEDMELLKMRMVEFKVYLDKNRDTLRKIHKINKLELGRIVMKSFKQGNKEHVRLNTQMICILTVYRELVFNLNCLVI